MMHLADGEWSLSWKEASRKLHGLYVSHYVFLFTKKTPNLIFLIINPITLYLLKKNNFNIMIFF